MSAAAKVSPLDVAYAIFPRFTEGQAEERATPEAARAAAVAEWKAYQLALAGCHGDEALRLAVRLGPIGIVEERIRRRARGANVTDLITKERFFRFDALRLKIPGQMVMQIRVGAELVVWANGPEGLEASGVRVIDTRTRSMQSHEGFPTNDQRRKAMAGLRVVTLESEGRESWIPLTRIARVEVRDAAD